jgi:Protein of unknown function (DUF2971)
LSKFHSMAAMIARSWTAINRRNFLARKTMILYQYRRSIDGDENFGYFVDLLKDGKMKFGKFSEFNDPFDCCPGSSPEMSNNVAIPHVLLDEINRTRQSATSMLHGAACFTIHPDSMLMWSHYGNQHKSVCVGFDRKTLIKNVPLNDEGNPLYEGIDKVKYVKNRPMLGSKQQFTRKSMEWKYENEYRLISQEKPGKPPWGPGVFCLPPNAIKEVVIGARVRPSTVKKIVRTVESINLDIAIKKVVPHPNTFDLAIVNIKDLPEVDRSCVAVSGANDNWHYTE